MRIFSKRRALLAVVAVTALVGLSGSPASATDYHGQIHTGTIRVYSSNMAQSFDIVFGTGTSAECPPSHITVRFTGTTTGGSFHILTLGTIGVDNVLGGDYRVDLQLASGFGTGTTGTGTYTRNHTTGVQRWTAHAEFYAVISESDIDTCEAGDFVCDYAFDLTVHGTYSGHAPANVTTMTVDTASTDQIPLTPIEGCSAPFATFTDGSVGVISTLTATV